MIARIIVPIVLVFILCDVYIDRCLLSRQEHRRTLKRTLWFVQSVLMLGYAIMLASSRSFAPVRVELLNWFLLLLGVWALPKLAFTVCSLLGRWVCAGRRPKRNSGNLVGVAAGAAIAALTVYGYTVGFGKLRVRHVTYESADLPEAFDGYRIVQFSDAHVGTYGQEKLHLLAAAVDSINAQHADAVVFTGDLQNMQPSELAPCRELLKSLKAPDGVFSILGNHDYAYYLNADKPTMERKCREMVEAQKAMGWTLLMNGNRVVRRGGDSIVVAGMEYEGKSVKVPSRGDIRRTLAGVRQDSAFVLMLQHDPTSWSTDILPHSKAQLTLSGHTHGGQLELFGWSPVALLYDQWDGMYYSGSRALFVSTGVGGFVPFRIGCPGEIVVVQLKRKK